MKTKDEAMHNMMKTSYPNLYKTKIEVKAIEDGPVNYPNLKSDLRLFDADGEVHVGDIVRYGGKPCIVEYVLANAGLVGVMTMCERKYSFRVKPEQIGCVFGKGETNGNE